MIKDIEQELINDMASFTHDPYKFVIYSFAWGEGELKDFDGPDEWQTTILCKVRDGFLTLNKAICIAIASGHGVGKSALAAWLILWGMSTHEDTRGVVTANTESQLRTKTWAELAKWHRLFIAKHWFSLTATAIYSNDKEHEKTWRIDIIPWSEHKTEAFAGLHNKGKRIILIFDESSAIVDAIWEVSEGALTDEDTEILWFVFGNPTRNQGRFFDCFHRLKHRWITRQIDSRTCKMTNKEEINRMVEDYGIDSDFVKVRVTGEFPNTSVKQFIPSDYVDAARGRGINPANYNFAAKVMSVDPAGGGKNEAVIGLRQGNFFKILAIIKKTTDDYEMARIVSRYEDEEVADAVFVDFGYGTGLVSAGRQLRRSWILVPFGGASSDQQYLNKRAQMYGDTKYWLRDGGCIPEDKILVEQLKSPEGDIVEKGPNAGKQFLESKKDMIKRGITDLGRADGLALTFAAPVAPRNRFRGRRVDGVQMPSNQEFAKSDYNVLG